jgi:hypothetical protein
VEDRFAPDSTQIRERPAGSQRVQGLNGCCRLTGRAPIEARSVTPALPNSGPASMGSDSKVISMSTSVHIDGSVLGCSVTTAPTAARRSGSDEVWRRSLNFRGRTPRFVGPLKVGGQHLHRQEVPQRVDQPDFDTVILFILFILFMGSDTEFWAPQTLRSRGTRKEGRFRGSAHQTS